MRARIATGLVVALALTAALPQAAQAACPNIPDAPGTYIDFADGSVKFRSVFAKPGLVVASNGKAIPRTFRAAGAGTAYFELHMENIVGLPGSPKAASGIIAAADAEYTKAVDSTGCSTPLIALDEFESGSSTGPFTGRAATYRQNVIMLMTRLRDRGARVFLLIPSGFSVSGRGAAQFWRNAASVGELLPEVYPNGRLIHARGPVVGSRSVRIAYRTALAKLIALGIPPQKLGLFIGFQSQSGNGGREGLKPLSAWLRVVKWKTLSAETISRELGIGTIWSWGWGTFSSAGADADKPTVACVYLWTRNPSLCPQAVGPSGPGFDTSLREGRLKVPGDHHCVWKDGGRIAASEVTRLEVPIGGRQRALNALLQAGLAKRAPGLKSRLVSAAEAAIIRKRFGGDRAAYKAALAQRALSQRIARRLITIQVAKREVDRRERKRGESFAEWLSKWQARADKTMTCRRDEVPVGGATNPIKRFSFLKVPKAT